MKTLKINKRFIFGFLAFFIPALVILILILRHSQAQPSAWTFSQILIASCFFGYINKRRTGVYITMLKDPIIENREAEEWLFTVRSGVAGHYASRPERIIVELLERNKKYKKALMDIASLEEWELEQSADIVQRALE